MQPSHGARNAASTLPILAYIHYRCGSAGVKIHQGTGQLCRDAARKTTRQFFVRCSTCCQETQPFTKLWWTLSALCGEPRPRSRPTSGARGAPSTGGRPFGARCRALARNLCRTTPRTNTCASCWYCPSFQQSTSRPCSSCWRAVPAPRPCRRWWRTYEARGSPATRGRRPTT